MADELSDLSLVSTVIRAAVIGRGSGVLVLALDDLLRERVEHSIVARVDGGVGRMLARLRWETRGVCCAQPDLVWCVGARGRFAEIGSSVRTEQIDAILDEPGLVGLVRDCAFNGGAAYALCLDGRLLMRTHSGGWDEVIEAASGAVMHRLGQGWWGDGRFMAASADGGLYEQRGRRWTQLDWPGSAIITSLWRSGPERVMACGLRGALLIGQADAFRVLDHAYMHEDFWGICEFEGQRFIASLHHLYRMLDDESLERIDPLDSESFYGFAQASGVLWSVGGKDVLEFSGGKWSRII